MPTSFASTPTHITLSKIGIYEDLDETPQFTEYVVLTLQSISITTEGDTHTHTHIYINFYMFDDDFSFEICHTTFMIKNATIHLFFFFHSEPNSRNYKNEKSD